MSALHNVNSLSMCMNVMIIVPSTLCHGSILHYLHCAEVETLKSRGNQEPFYSGWGADYTARCFIKGQNPFKRRIFAGVLPLFPSQVWLGWRTAATDFTCPPVVGRDPSRLATPRTSAVDALEAGDGKPTGPRGSDP